MWEGIRDLILLGDAAAEHKIHFETLLIDLLGSRGPEFPVTTAKSFVEEQVTNGHCTYGSGVGVYIHFGDPDDYSSLDDSMYYSSEDSEVD